MFELDNQNDILIMAGVPASLAAVVELGSGTDTFLATDHHGTSQGRVELCTGDFDSQAGDLRYGHILAFQCATPAVEDRTPAEELPSEAVTGGAGDDHLMGTDHRDGIDGGAGNDDIFLAGGDDVGVGGPGTDVIHGGQGDDLLDVDLLNRLESSVGNAGTRAVEGDDILNGMGGKDTVGYRFETRPVRADQRHIQVVRSDAEPEFNVVSAAEEFFLGKGDDSFVRGAGDATSITVHGFEGDDNIDVSGNPSAESRDVVYCGGPNPGSRDVVKVDGPRLPHLGEVLPTDPTQWLLDSTDGCEQVEQVGLSGPT